MDRTHICIMTLERALRDVQAAKKMNPTNKQYDEHARVLQEAIQSMKGSKSATTVTE